MNPDQSSVAADDHRTGKLRLAHYKGSLVIVKPFHGDVAPTVTHLDKVEMTAVRRTPHTYMSFTIKYSLKQNIIR